MFPRKFLFPLLLLFSVAIILVGGACKSSKAETERTESSTGAPVVNTSPTPTGDPISISAVGDTMLGSTYQGRGLPERDGAEMISGLTPIISSADIAFANLEGPLIDNGESTK